MLFLASGMVNQNAENEVYHDFKYWEDRSDEFRDGRSARPSVASGRVLCDYRRVDLNPVVHPPKRRTAGFKSILE